MCILCVISVSVSIIMFVRKSFIGIKIIIIRKIVVVVRKIVVVDGESMMCDAMWLV